MNDIEIVGPEYVAGLLGITIGTLKTDASQRPESLPPRLKLPGRRGYAWLKSDVHDWIVSLSPAKKKRKST